MLKSLPLPSEIHQQLADNPDSVPMPLFLMVMKMMPIFLSFN